MSKDHDHDDAGHGTHTIRASKGGGGGGKLLLVALAAVLLAGGGYYAWQTYGQPNSAQTAYNDSYTTDPYDDSLRAGPVESSTSDDLAENTAAEPASSAAPPATRRTQPRSEPVPEATFGVTPASVSEEEFAANDQDDIVVTAAPRPIWVRTPSERRLSSLYPARALERGREGEARLACTVQNGGALDCASVESTPGFSNAAIRVSRTLRHAAQRADGTDATGTPVNLRVVFRIDENTRRG